MMLKLKSTTFFIFDLDDTLYPEITYLESAYRHIATHLTPHLQKDLYNDMITRYHAKENVFEWLIHTYAHLYPSISMPFLLQLYREHEPSIKLSSDTRAFLDALKAHRIPMGLITNGRSLTQRNKLKALQLTDYFQDIIISEEFGSEKPDERNYLYFENRYPGQDFWFVGDNTSKDFAVPFQLKWHTICILDSGHHIYSQEFELHTMPEFLVKSLGEIQICL